MSGGDRDLTDESLQLLVDAMSAHLRDPDRSAEVANMFIRETIRFRDKLKQETGEILTVGDTRLALEALGSYLDGKGMPAELTPEQKALAQIWIDRLTLFDTNPDRD